MGSGSSVVVEAVALKFCRAGSSGGIGNRSGEALKGGSAKCAGISLGNGGGPGGVAVEGNGSEELVGGAGGNMPGTSGMPEGLDVREGEMLVDVKISGGGMQGKANWADVSEDSDVSPGFAVSSSSRDVKTVMVLAISGRYSTYVMSIFFSCIKSWSRYIAQSKPYPLITGLGWLSSP